MVATFGFYDLGESFCQRNYVRHFGRHEEINLQAILKGYLNCTYENFWVRLVYVFVNRPLNESHIEAITTQVINESIDMNHCRLNPGYDEYRFEDANHFIKIMFPQEQIQKIFIKVLCVLENLRNQYEQLRKSIEGANILSDIHKIVREQINNYTIIKTPQEDILVGLVAFKPMFKELQHNVFLKSIVESTAQKPNSTSFEESSSEKHWMSKM
ncbi:hypothetical protein RF11_02345 [Thelohanellus kitauei]|uniref:Uncharacterized protein n=1 Tax=Thelohanellus kitauei TaxID=669202 RepID=A0A0C2JVA6_THEKT|nr:hypothetical protein RF11_02345 [Thelohanellus kitauei]